MFEVKDLNEFINKLFDNAIKSKNDDIDGLITFRKYLVDTSMCDCEYLKVLDKIIECRHELLELKKKMKGMDVVFFVEYTLNGQNRTSGSKPKKKSRNIVSDSCGGGNVSNNRCGGTTSTQSDSCGGGSYSRRC